jgi:hypothetical protein
MHPDVVEPHADGIFFYHRVLEEWPSMWDVDLANQQMPADVELTNPQINSTFGGYLTGGADSVLTRSGPNQLTSASSGTSQMLSVAGIAGTYTDVTTFRSELTAAVAMATDRAAHGEYWAGFWANATINVTAAAAPANAAVAAAAQRVTLMDRVNRAAFHSMALGNHAIKFNAYGIYSAYPEGQEDYRVWGPCQWFQNIRLPYYHMLADGRFEDMKSLFGFYSTMLPLSKARARKWFGLPSGAFFPETKQQNGLYASGGLGWGCHSASPTVPIPENTYIRYHREGGLELSLLALDWFAHTGDLAYFQRTLLPQIEAYVDYYAQHFGNDADGRLDIFPGQALETWQCKTTPPSRADCVTNPMPEVAGLHAVLPRLLGFNSSVVPAATLAKWAALRARVPPLPVGKCSFNKPGWAGECLVPGTRLPRSTSNSENAEMSVLSHWPGAVLA